MPTKIHIVKAIVFPVVMYRELDQKEAWALKNWCFPTVVLEKTLESLLDCKEIQPVNPKGNQPWILTARTDAEVEALMLWPPDGKSQFTGKNPDSGKDWGQEEKGTTEDEMVGWHHQLNGHEFDQTLGNSEGQGSLACCSPWSHKDLNTTWQLNNNDNTCWSFVLEGNHWSYQNLGSLCINAKNRDTLLGEISTTSDIMMIQPLRQKVKRN